MPKLAKPTVDTENKIQLATLKGKYKDLLDMPSTEPLEHTSILPTPSVQINDLTGPDKGIRKGSIVHWYGPKGSLKTWFALEMCREAQKKWPDKIAAYIDSEYRVDLNIATAKIGVTTDVNEDGQPSFIYRRPRSAEEAWEMVLDFCNSGLFSIIVIDSLASMRAKAENENDAIALGQVGLGARINSAALRKVAPLVEESGTILWLINQERIIQVQPIVMKGPTGGAAPGFYATHEFKAQRISREKNEEARTLSIISEKMKYALGLREIEVPIILGHGINAEADLIEFACEKGVVLKNSSWFSIEGDKIGQGLENSAEVLRNNPALRERILKDVEKLA